MNSLGIEDIRSKYFSLLKIDKLSSRFWYTLWKKHLDNKFIIAEMLVHSKEEIYPDVIYSSDSLEESESKFDEIFSGKIGCELCGEKFPVVTHSHLRACHNISVQEYKDMFPNSSLMSHKYRADLSEYNLQIGKCPPKMFGNKYASYSHTEEHKDKTRKTMLNKWANDLEYRQKCSEGNSRAKKEAWNDPAYARKMAIAWQEKPSGAELPLIDCLDPSEWRYVGDRSFSLERQSPDFMNVNGKKLLIEMNGCKWHCCKQCGFGGVGLPNGMTPEDVRLDDAKKLEIFSRYGFKTLVIWEHELKDLPALLERINSFSVAGKLM